MDIYRKELEEIYKSQHLWEEKLDSIVLKSAKDAARTISMVGRGCCVITDASCDHCYIYGGAFGALMGIFTDPDEVLEVGSSDEDIIYTRIHPEDLVDKRLLEYKFFLKTRDSDPTRKLDFIARCRIRINDGSGRYYYVDNSTQLISLSPAGKIWLILCRYDFSSNQEVADDIAPTIIDTSEGEIERLDLGSDRQSILTIREKEILLLIQQGLPSKQIADRLHISPHTVNRHRQNILSKLDVANSIEAVSAAARMRLL